MILRYEPMVSSRDRVKQEQIRKRRNNLLRRHDDFWRLYAIRSWTTLEMPNGRTTHIDLILTSLPPLTVKL